MEQGWNNAWAAVVEFTPKLVAFLIILIVGLIVAKLISKALDKILERAGFDRAVERGGIKRALEHSKFDASDIVSRLLYYILALFVLQLAFGVFGPNPISDLISSVIAFLPKLVVAIVIIVVAAAIAAAVRTLIEGALGGMSYGKVLATIAAVAIWALGIIAALNQIDVATTVTTPVLIAVLAAIVGVIVVGVGGGLIKPMQQRWEGYLTAMENEIPQLRSAVQSAPPADTQLQSRIEQIGRQEPPSAPSGI
ncbi:MAG: hypothetical protein EPO13_10255 [Actinomycetota bacterium]|nr:MAG: hypothetical protein EPO13_10255 [Actinomycetota bacterium]